MRGLDGKPKWELRTLLLLHQRLRSIVFVALAWLSVGIMAQVSPFPSRRYLLQSVAALATA